MSASAARRDRSSPGDHRTSAPAMSGSSVLSSPTSNRCSTLWTEASCRTTAAPRTLPAPVTTAVPFAPGQGRRGRSATGIRTSLGVYGTPDRNASRGSSAASAAASSCGTGSLPASRSATTSRSGYRV